MNSEKNLFFDQLHHKVEDHPNVNLSKDQLAFEAWARPQMNEYCTAHLYDMRRNFYVPYHGSPYSEEELFGQITEWNYYGDARTQGAWDGWRARAQHAVSL